MAHNLIETGEWVFQPLANGHGLLMTSKHTGVPVRVDEADLPDLIMAALTCLAPAVREHLDKVDFDPERHS